VHWPAGGLGPRIVDDAFQLTDVVPTVLEATGAEYPASYAGHEPLPLEGRSMLPALRGGRVEAGTLYWEHIGNTAIRRGRFKLVREHGQPWDLYDIETDRAELVNVAASHLDVVAELAIAWQAWANRVGVIPWERVQEIYRRENKGDPAA
jgi:arylsulfatase